MILRFLSITIFALGVGKCTGTTTTYDISAARPSLAVATERSVAVAVIDARPYVLSGEKSYDFIGTARGEYSNTADVLTASGRPLAEEMTDAVVGALGDRGAAAAGLALPREADAAAMLAAFEAQGSDRLLAVTIREWRTDAYTRVKVAWSFEAAVYDRTGQLVGRNESQGSMPVGQTTLQSDSSAVANSQLSQRLSLLLNERPITAALQ